MSNGPRFQTSSLTLYIIVLIQIHNVKRVRDPPVQGTGPADVAHLLVLVVDVVAPGGAGRGPVGAAGDDVGQVAGLRDERIDVLVVDFRCASDVFKEAAAWMS